MKLILERKWFTTQSTIGELTVEGTDFKCYTLEDVARALGVKIYGQTAIPAACYKVKLTYSNRFKIELPLIYNTDDFKVDDTMGAVWAGIRIHPGNTHEDTDGCVLPGLKRGENAVYQSRNAMDELMKVVFDTPHKKQMEHELIIKNSQI